MENETIEAKLQLQMDGESFTGRVTAGGESAAFTGWLGLMSVVESLLMETAGTARLGRDSTEGNP